MVLFEDQMAQILSKKVPAKTVLSFIMRNRVFRSLFIALCAFFYCEFLHYGVVLMQCTWPVAPSDSADDDLRVMFIADTHILGFKQGHWFDRLRREWQMKHAFQTTMLIHKPDAVFVLGDLMDEGKWCPDEEFDHHVTRFRSMFQVPDGTAFHVVSGNHDEGFHYMMSPHKHDRFEKAFNSPSVRMIKVKNVPFLLVNSMAMEGDGCTICQKAEKQLNVIARKLRQHRKCTSSAEKSDHCHKFEGQNYVEPILLQHYPMYRVNDAECNLEDSAPPQEKTVKFRIRYDCLDERSSEMLFSKIQPRLVVSGHTHHGCLKVHPNGVPEWSVSSFSWRNRNNPTYLMARIGQSNFTTKQCFLPEESTVIYIYTISAIIFVFSLFWPTAGVFKRRQKKCTS